jgi:hypothetical protein
MTKVNDAKLVSCRQKRSVSPEDLQVLSVKHLLSVKQRHKLCQKALLTVGVGRIQQGRRGKSMPLSDNRFLIGKGHEASVSMGFAKAAFPHAAEGEPRVEELNRTVVNANAT